MTLIARFRKLEKKYYTTLLQNDEVYEIWKKDRKAQNRADLKKAQAL